VEHYQFQQQHIQLRLVLEVLEKVHLLMLEEPQEIIQFFQQLHQQVEEGVEQILMMQVGLLIVVVLAEDVDLMVMEQEEQEIHLQ
jgi:hypothetical protein